MSGYIGNTPVPQATQSREAFTATASQTTFATIGYTVGFLDVFLNGVHLINGTDYTATNGSDVVLTTGAAAGDILEVISYSTYEVNNQAFTGDFSVDTDVLYVDSTNNRVGVGKTSPATALDVTGTVTADGLTVDGDTLIQGNSGMASGTGTPVTLEIKDTSAGGSWVSGDVHAAIDFFSSDGSGVGAGVRGRIGIAQETSVGGLSSINMQVAPTTAGTMQTALKVDGTGDISFYEDTGTTAKFFWDASAESLGIGTAAPTSINGNSTLLEVSAPSGTAEYILRGSTAVASWWAGSSAANIGTTSNHPMKFHTNNTERMQLDASGNLLVGTTVTQTAGFVGIVANGSSGTLHTGKDSTSARTHFGFWNPNGQVGSITTTGSTTSYNTSSDYRLKEDWQPLTGASERVLALNPVNFTWKADGSRVDGFLAHEAQAVVPEAVTGEKDAVDEDGNPDYQAIDQSKLVPLLTAALQEALNKIDDLEARLSALEVK